MCEGYSHCTTESLDARDHRRGRRNSKVRRVSGIDPRLSGASGRDAADDYPGLRGWGAKSSAAVLAKFAHLESIPTDWREWRVNVASAGALADTLSRERASALLFRTLGTLRTDIDLLNDVEELRWNGPTPAFADLAGLDAAVTETRRPATSRSPGAPIVGSAGR